VNPGKPLFKIMEDMSTIDYNTKESKRFSYWYDSEKDKLWIPGGVGDAYVREKYPNTKINIMKYMSFKKMDNDLEMVHKPDDYQLTTLHNLIRDLKKNPQVKCTLPTGRGKTFVTVNVAMILKMKVLIVDQLH
jgi:superfamily II DNA or RNA helicase